MNESKANRPLFLTKPQTISRRDINRAEKLCGICIVECADPDATRFCEPPLGADLDEQARAALTLMRVIVNSDAANFTRAELTKWFVQELFLWKQPQTVKRVKP
jgi:hypothetical protein